MVIAMKIPASTETEFVRAIRISFVFGCVAHLIFSIINVIVYTSEYS